jgi:hypothetical protein
MTRYQTLGVFGVLGPHLEIQASADLRPFETQVKKQLAWFVWRYASGLLTLPSLQHRC